MASVSYAIELDGSPLADEVVAAVQEIEVEDHAVLADMLRLRLGIAALTDGSGWTLLDDDVFPRLANLTVITSIGSDVREVLIDSYVIETRFRLGGRPGDSSLEVVAMDPTVLMSLDEKVRAWPDMSDGDIASTVFGEYGFSTDIESTEPTRSEDDTTTIQRGTDMALLERLATRNGFEVYVESEPSSGDTVGHFHPPRLSETPQGVLSVAMGEATNVHEFEARFDMLRPATARAVGVAGGDQSDQEAEVSAAAADSLGSASLVPSDRPRHVLLSGSGLTDSGELQSLAQAVVDDSAWALSAEGVLSTASYAGILRAKRPLLVRGAGQRFSGLWYVEKVLHHIEGARYRQHFSLRRNAVGLAGGEDFSEGPTPA